MDTTDISPEERPYLPLLLEAIFESPIDRNGQLVPHEEVVAELSDDTVSTCGNIGLCSGKKYIQNFFLSVLTKIRGF